MKLLIICITRTSYTGTPSALWIVFLVVLASDCHRNHLRTCSHHLPVRHPKRGSAYRAHRETARGWQYEGLEMVMEENMAVLLKKSADGSQWHILTHQIFMPPQFAVPFHFNPLFLPKANPTLVREIVTIHNKGSYQHWYRQSMLIMLYYGLYHLVDSLPSSPHRQHPHLRTVNWENNSNIRAQYTTIHHFFISTVKRYSNRFRFDFGDHLFAQLVK